MKVGTFYLGAVCVFILYVFFPFLAVVLNERFSLTVFNGIVLDIFGLVLIVVGISPTLYSIILFKKEGFGTPVPIEPPRRLVIKGLYKYVRNPMYAGHLIVFLGLFLLLGHVLLLAYIGISALFFYLLVVAWEEPVLKKRFGQKYLDYCQKVPRWGIRI